MITQEQYDWAMDNKLTAEMEIAELKLQIAEWELIINEFEKQEEPL